MALIKYRSNRQGVKDLLSLPGVMVDLRRRGEKVAAAASADYTARPPHQGEVDVEVDASIEPASRRGRAAVIAHHPGALGIEADRRPLGSALDAAG